MSNLTAKDKLKDGELKEFEEMDGRLIMLETLKNHGLSAFPETRKIPIDALVNTAVIHFGWKFTDTVKRYALYYLIRFYKRNDFEVSGTYGKEQIKMQRSVFNEIEAYEKEWKARTARQTAAIEQ